VKSLIRSVVLAALIVLIPSGVKAAVKADDFMQTLSHATLGVYTGGQVCKFTSVDTFFGPMSIWGCKFENRFTCTATVIAREGFTDYVGLTAGHCIDWAQEDKYFVSSSIGKDPVMHHIHILKTENDDRYDYCVFRFESLDNFPVIGVDVTGGVPQLGTPVMNVNFSFGIGKHFSYGHVSSEPLDDDAFGEKQRFMTSLEIAPGASGSAVVDTRTHKIIGLAEFEFNRGNLGAGVIPTGKRFMDFMQDDSAGIKPLPEPPPTTAVPEHIRKFLNSLWKVVSYLGI
jgi:Trypsin-like peptidase domain